MIIETKDNIVRVTGCTTHELMSVIDLYKKEGIPAKSKGKLQPCIKYGLNYINIEGELVHFRRTFKWQ